MGEYSNKKARTLSRATYAGTGAGDVGVDVSATEQGTAVGLVGAGVG